MTLIDVGVWLAAVWAGHVHHRIAKQWFDEQSDDLLLCRVTQMSLLRVVSNRAIMGDDVLTCGEAWRIVDRLRADDRVVWADEPPQLETAFRAISAQRVHSHKLWTDDYLAAFAQTSGASLATLDGAMKERYPAIRVEQLI